MQRMFSIILFLILCGFHTTATACETGNPNSLTNIETQDAIKCINLTQLNAETWFVADSSILKNAAYNIKVTTPDGSVLVNQELSFATNTFTIAQQLQLAGHNEVKITLTPLTGSRNYRFTIIHDHNTVEDLHTIYVGLNSEVLGNNTPPGGINPMQMFATTVAVNQLTEASQCNDANRPPTPPPINSNSGIPFNINGYLRATKEWMQQMHNTMNVGAVDAAALARAYVVHNIDGALDLSHANETSFVGDAAMGNFLFGASMAAMDYDSVFTLRMSAAFQAISDDGLGWSSVIQGIYNYVTNTGDSPGDPEQVMAGANYYHDVFTANGADSALVSCIDSQSLDQEDGLQEMVDSSPGSGGGSGEGDGDPGDTGGDTGGNSGGSTGSGGTVWCFVDSKGDVQFCWRS